MTRLFSENDILILIIIIININILFNLFSVKTVGYSSKLVAFLKVKLKNIKLPKCVHEREMRSV